MRLSKHDEKRVKKADKLARHLWRFPEDKAALSSLKKINYFCLAVALKRLPENMSAHTVALLEGTRVNAYWQGI